MRFSDKLTVTALDRDTRIPAKNVAILLVLFAARKNDYCVGPLITDEKGQVHFTRKDCEFAIERAKKMFLMDYQGGLEDCRPFVEVRLHRPESIQTMLRNYTKNRIFWGGGFQDPERLFAGLEKVTNADYEPASLRVSEEQVLNNQEIELPLLKMRLVSGNALRSNA
jgi:hypothetical protein